MKYCDRPSPCRPPFHLAAALFLAVLVCGPGRAADRECELAWSVDLPGIGYAKDVAVEGDTLVCATDSGLLIFDAADPTSLQLLGGVTLGRSYGNVLRLAVEGEIVLAATSEGMLHAVDLSSPRSPVVLGSADLASTLGTQGSWVVAVSIRDGLACVQFHHGVTAFVRVDSPVVPTIEGSIDLQALVTDVELVGDYAYIALLDGGVRVVDSADPFNPKLASWFDSGNSVFGLHVSGTRLWLAEGDSGLQVVDISDPFSLESLGSSSLGGHVTDLIVRGNTAFASVHGARGSREMTVVDVSDPLQVSILGSGSSVGERVGVLLNDYCVSRYYGHLRITGIGDPTAPQEVDEVWTTIPSGWSSVEIGGNLAFFSSRNFGFATLNIADQESPQWLGGIRTRGSARSLAVSGTTAYIGDSNFVVYHADSTETVVVGEGLLAVDFSDPTQLIRLGATLEGEVIHGVAVSGDTVYVATDAKGLVIVDASVNTDLRVVGDYRGSDAALAISVHGTNALVSYIGGQVDRLDISDPRNPVKTGDILVSGDSPTLVSGTAFVVDYGGNRDWDVYGTSLYEVGDNNLPVQTARLLSDSLGVPGVADGGVLKISRGRLEGYRFDTFSNPQHVRRHELGNGENGWTDFEVSGNLACATDYENGLAVIDLSSPASPIQLGALSNEELGVGAGARGLELSPDRSRLFVAGETGTRIVDVSDPQHPIAQGLIRLPALSMKASGDLLYVSHESTVTIVDSSDPGTPTIVGEFSLGTEWYDRVWAIECVGSLAAVVSERTFALFDTRTTVPTLVSRLEFDDLNFEYGGELRIVGNLAYMAAGYAGMLIIDISNPEQPTLVGTLPGSEASAYPAGHASAGSFSDIEVDGGSAYLLDSHQGRVVVADVSDPTDPYVVGRNTTFAAENKPGRMSVNGDHILVAFQSGNPDLVVFGKYSMLRMGLPFVRREDQLIRIPLKGVNVKRALIQRSADLATWEDWKTMDLEDNTGEVADFTSGEPQFFYRAVQDTTSVAE